MTPAEDALVERIRALAARPGRPSVVGISGHGGAGKTTLARSLAGTLGQVPAQVVALDRLYAVGARDTAGLRGLHDWPVVRTLLASIGSGPATDRLTYPTRQWSGEEGVHDVPMPSVVLVEGIRLFWPDTVGLFDLTVWIDLDPATAAARAVARNRGQGDDDVEVDLWRTRWLPEGTTYEREVEPARLADLVIPAHV